MEPELGLRLRLGLELALGCQGTDANRPKKLIPALGPYWGPTSSSSWSRRDEMDDWQWCHETRWLEGPATPLAMPYLELTAGIHWVLLISRDVRITFVSLREIWISSTVNMLKNWNFDNQPMLCNYQSTFSPVNQISFKHIRSNIITLLCGRATLHPHVPLLGKCDSFHRDV